MKHKRLLIIIASAALILAVFFIARQIYLSKQMPANFNLVFKYGVGAKNELNTFNHTYTKDMVADESVTTDLKLTDKELKNIYQKIMSLRLLDKNITKNSGNTGQTPCSMYYLKIKSDLGQNELSWNNCYGEVNDRLQKFTNYLIQIIESKDEYKALPTPKAAYL